MDIGMLWNDDDRRRSLTEKVARAAEYYRSKYGEAPTVCYVHPSLLPAGEVMAAGLRLMPSKSVLVNHFWLGVNGATQPRGVNQSEVVAVAPTRSQRLPKRRKAGVR